MQTPNEIICYIFYLREQVIDGEKKKMSLSEIRTALKDMRADCMSFVICKFLLTSRGNCAF